MSVLINELRDRYVLYKVNDTNYIGRVSNTDPNNIVISPYARVNFETNIASKVKCLEERIVKDPKKGERVSDYFESGPKMLIPLSTALIVLEDENGKK